MVDQRDLGRHHRLVAPGRFRVLAEVLGLGFLDIDVAIEDLRERGLDEVSCKIFKEWRREFLDAARNFPSHWPESYWGIFLDMLMAIADELDLEL